MGRKKPRPHKDDILEAKEAEHTKPKRKSRKKQAEYPAGEPAADVTPALSAQELKDELGLKSGDELPRQLPPPTEADLPQADVQPSFTERVRPMGPRPRAVGEPGSTFTSVDGGFRLTEDGMERAFEFNDQLPPSSDEKAAMQGAGLRYRSARKKWTSLATPEVREASDELALRFSGKRERIEEERGR